MIDASVPHRIDSIVCMILKFICRKIGRQILAVAKKACDRPFAVRHGRLDRVLLPFLNHFFATAERCNTESEDKDLFHIAVVQNIFSSARKQ
jgi:hypothetical protein